MNTNDTLVYLLHVQQNNGEDVKDDDFHSTDVYFDEVSAYMNAFHIIAEWVDGDFGPYNANITLKFRESVSVGDFAHALNLWNNHMSTSCFVSVEEVSVCKRIDANTDAPREALQLLFG